MTDDHWRQQPRDEWGRWTDVPGGGLQFGDDLRKTLTDFAGTPILSDDELRSRLRDFNLPGGLEVSRWVDALHEEKTWGIKPRMDKPASNPVVQFLTGGSQAGYVARVWLGDKQYVLKKLHHLRDIENEENAGHLANALGLPFDAYRVLGRDADSVVMPHIDGPMGFDVLVYDHPHNMRHTDPDAVELQEELLHDTPGSFEIAVLDMVTLNNDRNLGNVVLHPGYGFVPIDHSYANLDAHVEDEWNGDFGAADELVENMFLSTRRSHFVGHWFGSDYTDTIDFENVPLARLEALLRKVEDDLVHVPEPERATIISRLRALVWVTRHYQREAGR